MITVFDSIKKILAGIIAIISCGVIQLAKGPVTDGLPKVASDFVPEVRFVTYTDTHNQNQNVAQLFETVYSMFDDDETYKGVDAVIGLGDFSSIGTEPDYKKYTDTLKQYEREGTKIINILGNHEMKNEEAVELFEKYFGYEPNTVTEINGFSFICFSGSPHITEWTFAAKDLAWASEQLEKAEEKADGKAIFVFQHPHNFGTVYGSTVWCSPQTNLIWAGHSNVVNFSGHSHFPMNDPRSINQTTYTSVGVGAMATFELDRNYIVGQHPDGYDTAKQFCVVEADSKGRVRIREYDLNSNTCFNDYFLENVNDSSTFAYNYYNMRANDSKPVFDDDTTVSCKMNDNGEWVISFDEAKDNYIVHDYKITIKNSLGLPVYTATFVDDYYVIDGDNTADFRIDGDKLTDGEDYTAVIVAENAYHMKSTRLVQQFTAGE